MLRPQAWLTVTLFWLEIPLSIRNGVALQATYTAKCVNCPGILASQLVRGFNQTTRLGVPFPYGASLMSPLVLSFLSRKWTEYGVPRESDLLASIICHAGAARLLCILITT